ncbi:MAG: alpha/beta fold hydrolase [Siculibacillus sp.]|nr:alpha/beta fold hydrolase [Siculibacillus sp.]
MLVWLLRGILLIEISVAVSIGPTGVVPLVGFVGVIVLAVAAGLLLLAYSIAIAAASPRPPGVGGPTLVDGLAEWLGFVAGFCVIMPFERLWLGSDAVGRLPPGRRPVLLVHGHMCNRGFWWWMRRQLRGRGFAVATITLETPFSDIEILADRLNERIAALLTETGAERVDLVTHSMGGLVARAAMRKGGTARIARFVTLGGPHHGTVVARIGLGTNARQMRPGDPWLVELNRVEVTDVPTTTIWSTGDEIVAPQATSRLDGAREVVVAGIGHVAMAFSPRIRDLVVAELTTEGDRA